MIYRRVKELSEIETAYLAGLIDGEGTITLVKERKLAIFRKPFVCVSSTSYSLLKWCLDIVGVGSISQKKKYNDKHKQSYVWNVKGNIQCVELCRKLLPYLREEIKWKRAKKIVSEWNSVTVKNGKYSEERKDRKLKFEKEFFQIQG